MELRKIPKSNIVLPDDPLRKEMDEEFLEDLTKSIDDLGLLHPISVRPVRGGKFEVIYGGQRLASHPDEEIEVLITDLHKVKIRRKENLKIEEVAELQSIAENYMRKDISGPDLEKRIHAYHEKGWNQEKIADLTGISQSHICDLIEAWTVRQTLLGQKIDIDNVMRLPILTINKTKGLEPDERIRILKRAIEGKETSREVAKITAVIKKAEDYPEIKAEIIAGTIDPDIATRALEAAVGMAVDEDAMRTLIAEVQLIREYEAERMEAIIKGETTPTVVKMEMSEDEKRYSGFSRVWEDLKRYTHYEIRQIENPDIREKTIGVLVSMRDYCEEMLEKLGRFAVKISSDKYLKP